MRKLITIALVALVAVCANAASVNWTCSGFSALPDTTAASTAMKAYWLDGSTWSAFGALEADKVAAYVRKTGVAGTTSNSRGSISATGSYGNYSANESVSGYVVVLSTDSDQAAYYSASGALYTTTIPAAGSNVKPTIAFATGTTGWMSTTPEPTPEPTSGLLLLVGMAGLSLRRCRA